MNVKSYIFAGFLLIIGLFACKKTSPPDFHREYFGLEPGRFVVYDVLSINHDSQLGLHDTTYYQLKTVWGDTVIDNEGRIAREYLRYLRADANSNWALQDVWTGVIDGIRAELMEENQRTVKLVFAPTISKIWDANAYNMLDEIECTYTNIHQDTLINGISLDSSLIVDQDEYFSLIDTVKKYEVYAKGVGLVGKYFRDNHYQFGSSEVVLGTELFYEIVSTGIE